MKCLLRKYGSEKKDTYQGKIYEISKSGNKRYPKTFQKKNKTKTDDMQRIQN